MFRNEKPITAVTVTIDRITREEYEIDDLSDLPTLIEAIRLQQSTGAAEAARAIRKKLKYGNPHRQLRALVILDDLIQNAGNRFQRSFADEPLLERLRILVTDSLTDGDVKKKCNELYRQWAHLYARKEGMQGIANLYRQLPQKKRAVNKDNSRVLRETELQAQRDAEEHHDVPSTPQGRRASVQASSPAPSPASSQNTHRRVSSAAHNAFGVDPSHNQGSSAGLTGMIYGASSERSKSGKKGKTVKFDLEKEKPHMNQVISLASIESTNLINAMKSMNREAQRVSDNVIAKKRFETCKDLRRKTCRYCIFVEDERYIGTLLDANDKLSDALVLYEQLDRGFDYDSDSEGEEDDMAKAMAASHADTKGKAPASVAGQLASLNISNDGPPPRMPPRPAAPPVEEEDPDDPFADRNAVE